MNGKLSFVSLLVGLPVLLYSVPAGSVGVSSRVRLVQVFTPGYHIHAL